MFSIKTMTRQDSPFAVQITDQMNWGMVKEDFEFMMKLEPEGCFVLLDDRERVGIATTVSFGKKGWFGNLIIAESHRKKGAGSSLVRHSVDYLGGRGVETVGLYAYVNKVNFYRRLGFEYDLEFTVLKGKGFSSAKQEGVIEARKEDMRQIIDYDGLCFGASRSKVLEPLLSDSGNVGYVYMEGNRMRGYALAKVYDGTADLGPLVCPRGRSDLAISLLEAVLHRLTDAEVSLCLPKKEKSVISRLMENGFVESFPVVSMFLNPGTVNDCVYVAESLERG
jgi:predicted N-acetyltransferase YhbS